MIEIKDHIPDGLSRLVDLMVRIKTILIVVTLPIVPITFFMVVFLRYILEKDLFAYEEWLLMLCCWLYFLGSALGTYYDTQINADLMASITKNPTFLWMRKVAITLVELIITVIVLYWGILMIGDEIGMYPRWKTTIALKIPFIVPRIGIVVGFFFMTLYSALHLFVLFRIGAKKYCELLDKSMVISTESEVVEKQ